MNAPANFPLASPVAKLTSSITLNHTSRRGNETWCDFEVTYRFDGETDIDLITVRPDGPCDLNQFDLDELLCDELFASGIAHEAYAEWQADLADHLYDTRRDNRMVAEWEAGA